MDKIYDIFSEMPSSSEEDIMNALNKAWNAALDWTVENAKVIQHDLMSQTTMKNRCFIDRESILKGKIK